MAVLALALSSCSSKAERWLTPAPAPELAALEVKLDAPFSLAQQRGRVLLVSFGYTSCLSVCPLTLTKMHDVLSEVSELECLYVSVDPERDTPQHFREFLGDFDPRIRGLALEEARLSKTLEAWNVVATRRAPEVRRYVGRTIDPQRDYSIDHTASLWLIDGLGQLRVRFSPSATPEEIASAAQKLLDETAK